MKTISEVLALCTKFLSDKHVPRARRVAEELLSFTLGMKRLDLYLQFDRWVEEKELEALREPLRRCGKGEPLEYILGEVEFSGCRIFVDKRVLIPRPETELLVEKVKKKGKGGVLWDICTGSGCLGIALKKQFDQVVISDISEEALAVAKKNVEENGVEIEILQGDLLTPFAGRKADMVVCNPPYISESQYEALDPSVRDFEPRGALVGGTSFYERLSRELPSYLQPGAQVFLEIGYDQGEAVKKIFDWGLCEVEKDWAGHDRFFFLEMQ
jgi:release factor glutamine methyltransferase